jgi:hypothetical protein
MFRIDTPSRAVNLFGAGKDGYTNGDPRVAIPATQTSDAHLNAFQEEICRVLEGFGVVLDKTNNSQLLGVFRSLPLAVANWFLRTTLTGGLGFHAVAASDVLWVACGLSGAVYHSADAVNWTTASSGTESLNAVGWNGTQWVVVGGNGVVYSSPDGLTWTQRAIALVATTLRGVAWSGVLWVAVGDTGTIITSPDGITWTNRTLGSGETFRAVAYGAGSFVVVGDAIIRSSPDGITWTTRVVTGGSSPSLYGIAFDGRSWVAVGGSGVVVSSPDGFTWTLRSTPSSLALSAIAFDAHGVWLASGSSGVLLSSYDSVTWTPRVSTQSLALAGVRFAQGVWVVVGDQGLVLNSLRS